MGFQFKKFFITDDNAAMKVGTDAVLLGSWVDMSDALSILDIGAGTGILSLMAAQRTDVSKAKITAVEIDNEACRDAHTNIESSIWKDRISLVQSDFSKLSGQWDLIISNPPFFSSLLKSPTEARARARHGGDLNYFSLIEFSARNLSNEGSLAFISDLSAPPSEIIYCAEMNRLKVRRICSVMPRRDDETIRILWQMKRIDGIIERTRLPLRSLNNKDWSEEYSKLTNPFYLDVK